MGDMNDPLAPDAYRNARKTLCPACTPNPDTALPSPTHEQGRVTPGYCDACHSMFAMSQLPRTARDRAAVRAGHRFKPGSNFWAGYEAGLLHAAANMVVGDPTIPAALGAGDDRAVDVLAEERGRESHPRGSRDVWQGHAMAYADACREAAASGMPLDVWVRREFGTGDEGK